MSLPVPFPFHSHSCHSQSHLNPTTFTATPILQKLLPIIINSPRFYTFIWHTLPKWKLENFLDVKYNYKVDITESMNTQAGLMWMQFLHSNIAGSGVRHNPWDERTTYSRSCGITTVVSPAHSIPLGQKAVVVTSPTVFLRLSCRILQCIA